MRAVPLLALPLALFATTPAHAAVPWQVTSNASGFAPADLVIVQGDTLALTNVDPTGQHDLTDADTFGAQFRSAAAAFGQTKAVTGVASLPPGAYPFLCTIHEYMTGTLTVVAAR